MTLFGVASYPKKFKMFVISPLKICFQYSDIQVKLRTLGQDPKGLRKHERTHEPLLDISTSGTDLAEIAVGHHIKLVEELAFNLIEALRQYEKVSGEAYKSEFGSDFREFINKFKIRVYEL